MGNHTSNAADGAWFPVGVLLLCGKTAKKMNLTHTTPITIPRAIIVNCQSSARIA
jgi:hypothetical protein